MNSRPQSPPTIKQFVAWPAVFLIGPPLSRSTIVTEAVLRADFLRWDLTRLKQAAVKAAAKRLSSLYTSSSTSATAASTPGSAY